MSRTRIKICGITNAEDALEAVRLGADAIGLVFYPPSPRFVSAEQAVAICRVLPPFVTIVGLFVDAGRDSIDQILATVPLDLLQFHGNESAADCACYNRPYIKAVSMSPGLDVNAYMAAYTDARGFLLDTHHVSLPGGSGETFDWGRFPQSAAQSLILAGGLDANNVGTAITQLKPYGVDVSSGVEASKGVKDHARLAEFFQEVVNADARNIK
ncbi:MAG: phosphoribosylanthranilate isomerase [Gammaproteobacteria bacterium]|nr:phosphoribosylanthranilate isomerase [Gammaproteobacteria bacterium]